MSTTFIMPKRAKEKKENPVLELKFGVQAWVNKDTNDLQLRSAIPTDDFLDVAGYYRTAMEQNSDRHRSTAQWELLFLQMVQHIASEGGVLSTLQTPIKWVPDYANGVVFLLQIRTEWRKDLIYLERCFPKMEKKDRLHIASQMYTCPFVDDPTKVMEQEARQRRRDELTSRFTANRPATVINNYPQGNTGGGGKGKGRGNNNNNNSRQASDNASQPGPPPSTPVGHRTRGRGGEEKSR
jgi:hypothetical protein